MHEKAPPASCERRLVGAVVRFVVRLFHDDQLCVRCIFPLMNRKLSLMTTVDSILHALLWPAYKVLTPVKVRELPVM